MLVLVFSSAAWLITSLSLVDGRPSLDLCLLLLSSNLNIGNHCCEALLSTVPSADFTGSCRVGISSNSGSEGNEVIRDSMALSFKVNRGVCCICGSFVV